MTELHKVAVSQMSAIVELMIANQSSDTALRAKEMMDPHSFREQFQTVHLRLSRQMGHTSFAAMLWQTHDALVAFPKMEMARYFVRSQSLTDHIDFPDRSIDWTKRIFVLNQGKNFNPKHMSEQVASCRFHTEDRHEQPQLVVIDNYTYSMPGYHEQVAAFVALASETFDINGFVYLQ